MDDDKLINVDLLFGSIEIHNAPPLVDGDDLVMRGRTIQRDRYGNVTSDKTYETGLRLINGALPEFAYLRARFL